MSVKLESVFQPFIHSRFRIVLLLQRDSRRIGLWRSGRERGVWLLDIQRAAAARSVCAAAYAASVIRDR